MVAWAIAAAVDIAGQQDRKDQGLNNPAADAIEDQKSQELALQEVHGLLCEWADLVESVVVVVGAAEVD